MIIRLSFKVFLASFVFLFLVLVGVAFAQEEQDEVKKYNIQFPIVELGSCTSLSSCKAYCDNEVNRDVCVAFAKKKGFYKEQQQHGKNAALLQAAKSELGCDAETSCRAVCEQEANRDRCRTFAQRHNLGGQRHDPGSKDILEKAKTILGCDSESSCKAVCQDSANQEKCSQFAQQTGLGGGIRKVGPGGCNSEESCRAYCESHMDECRQFGGDHQGPPEADRRGPGGCNSEESCKAYCASHPDECRGFGGSGQNEQDRERFCRENPEKCREGRSGGPNTSYDEFCQKNPEKCRPSGGGDRQYYYDSSSRPSGYPEQYQQGSPGEYEAQFQGQYQQYESSSGDYGQSQPGGEQSSGEEYNAPPAQQTVQSAAVEPSLWQKIISFFSFR